MHAPHQLRDLFIPAAQVLRVVERLRSIECSVNPIG